VPLLHAREGAAFGDTMPFRKASAAAGGGGVLGDEDRVIAHRGLLPVIGNLGGGEPLGDEIGGVRHDGGEPLGLEVGELLSSQFEAAAKAGAGEAGEQVVEIGHLRLFYPRFIRRWICLRPSELISARHT
jgi:hypothetical protein